MEVESTRDLSQSIVHVDMDAFVSDHTDLIPSDGSHRRSWTSPHNRLLPQSEANLTSSMPL